jgi:hypothetical protein
MGKNRGSSLMELLIALSVLGAMIPALLGAFETVFLSGLQSNEYTNRISGAEWWFNRLETPARQADVDAMPRTDGSGKLRFRWETKMSEHGALHVTLSVSGGSETDAPFVTTRVY